MKLIILCVILFAKSYGEKIYKNDYSKILKKCKIEFETLEEAKDCKNFKVFGYDNDNFLIGLEINASYRNQSILRQWWIKNDEMYYYNFTLNNQPIDSIFMYRIRETKVDLIFKSDSNFYIASWDFIFRPENIQTKYLTNEFSTDFLFDKNWLLMFCAIEEYIVLTKFSLENNVSLTTTKRIFTINKPINDVIISDKEIRIKLKDQTYITFNVYEFQNIYGSLLKDVQNDKSVLEYFIFSQKSILIVLIIIIIISLIFIAFSGILMFVCNRNQKNDRNRTYKVPSILEMNSKYDEEDEDEENTVCQKTKMKPLNKSLFETKKKKVIPNGYHPDFSTVNEDTNEYSTLQVY